MTKFIGILNLTPDSFSDGGTYIKISDAIQHTKNMIDNGASIIDIGAESTKPNGNLINEEEEFRRLKDILPEIIYVCNKRNVKSSIDTRKVNIAKFAILNGINYINDVSEDTSASMLEVIAKNKNIKLIVTHSKSHWSKEKNNNFKLTDIIEWYKNTITTASKYNINTSEIIIDPGIGFGKTTEQSWNLIRNINIIQQHISNPICIGHSRKSFLHANINILSRDIETTIVSYFLATKSVDFLRVHNISMHKKMLSTLK